MKWVLVYFVLVLGIGVLLYSVGFGDEGPPRPLVIKEKIERVDLAKTQTYEKDGFVYMYVAPYVYTGSRGYLFPNGEFAYSGEVLNQIYSTPWGIMYWHGSPDRVTEPAGWLPYPNLRAAFPLPKVVRPLKNSP